MSTDIDDLLAELGSATMDLPDPAAIPSSGVQLPTLPVASPKPGHDLQGASARAHQIDNAQGSAAHILSEDASDVDDLLSQLRSVDDSVSLSSCMADREGSGPASESAPSSIGSVVRGRRLELRADRAPAFRLHCLSCDMLVLRIPDHTWSAGADYMHFRENHPNQAKLASGNMMLPLSGWAAYCCQCSWISIRPPGISRSFDGSDSTDAHPDALHTGDTPTVLRTAAGAPTALGAKIRWV